MEARVCVIGSGAAGNTVARHLDDSLLFESGTSAKVPEIQAELKCPLQIVDEKMEEILSLPTYGSESRTRRVGGSTHCWANYCRPLDAIDFEKVEWIPNSGWPFGLQELEPYYRLAYMVCMVPPIKHGEKLDEGEFVVSDDFETQVYRSRPLPVLFSEQYPVKCVSSQTFVRFEMSGGNVVGALFHGRDGVTTMVRAEVFVLACGGIENARILMSIWPSLPGLGKYFTEHIHIDIGRVKLHGVNSLKFYDLTCPATTQAVLVLKESVQRKLRVMNGQIDLDPMPSEGESVFRVRYIMAHVPSESSGIVTDGSTDKFGHPVVSLRLQHHEIERNTASAFMETLRDGLGSRGEVSPFDISTARKFIARFHMFGSHHIGMTRMGGSVDKNCAVIGAPNVFVAGSSVFPICGHAPPTLTIVAMSLRLAKHLGGKVAV